MGPGFALAAARAKKEQEVREAIEEADLNLPEEFVQEVVDEQMGEDLANEADQDRRATGPTQYALTDAGYYHPVGNTTGSLRPGMYSPVITQEGLFFIPNPIRTDNILRFPDAATDRVVSEIETFWEREEIFERYGMPFKRGMLLYGPPGSGKSTTLQLVARDVIRRGGIVLVFLPESWLQGYRAVRAIQPETPIVTFMEDLDALLERRESSTLNMLDGAERLHKVVFLATTNYPEKLDPRVKNRPSRFDRRFHIGHPGPEARRMYLQTLMDIGGAELDIDRYVKDTDDMSLAHLKELFVATIVLGQPYDVARDELRSMNSDRLHSADDVHTRVGRYA